MAAIDGGISIKGAHLINRPMSPELTGKVQVLKVTDAEEVKKQPGLEGLSVTADSYLVVNPENQVAAVTEQQLGSLLASKGVGELTSAMAPMNP